MEKFYLKYGKATDTANGHDYIVYRFFEVLPGALAWATFFLIIFFSYFTPLWASLFIITFDTYWLVKTVFLSMYLRSSYKKMRLNLKKDWFDILKESGAANKELGIGGWSEIYHLIILQFYKEPYEVVRETLLSLVDSNYPKDKMLVVLGVEERAGSGAYDTASRLKEELGGEFFKFFISAHPVNIAGETPGKGANETWAAREAKEKIIDPEKIPYQNIIVSSLDIDTRVYPDYFAIVSYNYLSSPKPLRSSFQPIPIYNNNIWDAPFFSRVVASSGTFWQMMQQARPERLATFSSHSIPLAPLVQMDYWHTNMVSEDSRIFWQALVYFDGDYRVVPLNYPVSMDANLAGNWRQTAKNVYRQQRRWIWGVENIPYLLFGFIKNKNIPLRKKLYFGFNQLEGFWSIGTNAIMIFVLGWLPVLIGGSAFGVSVLAHNLPRVTRWLMVLAMIGLATSAVYSLKLLPPRPPHRPAHHYFWMVIQWLLIPFTLIGFGSIPGIDAITRLMLGKYMGFWVTPKSRLTKDIL